MEIHLARHGETEANRREQFQGHDDTPLTEDGEAHAKAAARRLNEREYEYDVIFSSPLKRALDTAKLFAQELQTDIRMEPNLKEVCYGEWEGQPKAELQGTDRWERRTQDKYNFTHPGKYDGVPGESYADIFDRVAAFFDTLADADYDTVLVVTHLGVLRNAKKHFEGCSDAEAVAFTPDVSQVYAATVKEGNVDTTTLDVS